MGSSPHTHNRPKVYSFGMEFLTKESLRIVHVDDDTDFLALGERSLKRAGFERPIVRCTDGMAALDYFSTVQADHAPHVILVDLHMPRLNGLGVLHWVRTKYRHKNVAVYLLTSSENSAVINRAIADGVTAYLPKHTLFDCLVEKLDQFIRAHNQRQAASAPASNFASATQQ